MRWNRLIFVLCVGIFTFHANLSFPKNDSKNMELERSLLKAGYEIADIIIRKDVPALLRYIDKEKWAVNYGGDLSRNYEQVKKDLNDPKNAMYCFLFDASCMIEGYQKSIRDYLIEAKSRNMSIDVEVWHEFNETWGKIIYNWDEKPKDLWVSEFPNPELIYTKDGWKFVSLFAE